MITNTFVIDSGSAVILHKWLKIILTEESQPNIDPLLGPDVSAENYCSIKTEIEQKILYFDHGDV